MSATACLDSWVVLAWLEGIDRAQVLVEEALSGGRPVMSWINLVEVHYSVARDHGESEAEGIVEALRPRIAEELPGVARMREVARLKALHPVALADCFAITTAAAAGARLLTGDPEIIDRRAELPCEIVDCREAP